MELVKKLNNPMVLDPETKQVSRLTEKQFKTANNNVFDLDWNELEPVMNAGQYARATVEKAAVNTDPLGITDVFAAEWQEKAKAMFSEFKEARRTGVLK